MSAAPSGAQRSARAAPETRTGRRPSQPWLIRAAWALVAVTFACAFSLNGDSHYTIVLTILALVAASVAATNTQASLILVVAAPALDSFGILRTEPLDITVFQVVLIASLVGMAYRVVRRREPRTLWLTLWDVGVLTFLAAAVISVPLSHDLHRSLLGTIETAAEVGMYVLLSRAAPPEESRRRIGLTVVLVGVASGFVAMGQALFPRFPVPLIVNYPTGSSLFPQRVTAFFANPNSLALLLVLAAIVATERVLRSREIRHKWAWAAAGLVCSVGVALTFSREGLVGLLIGVVVTVLIASPDRRTTIVSLALVLGLAAGVFGVPGIGNRARSIYGFEGDPSAMDRVYLSRVSLEMFAEHPATGIGISAFASMYPRYRDPHVTMSPVTDGHQMPFSIPAETGILGLVAESIMVGFLVYLLPKTRTLSRCGIDVYGVAAVCAFFAMSFFNVFYYAEYFWIALAVVASTLRSASLAVVFETEVAATSLRAKERSR